MKSVELDRRTMPRAAALLAALVMILALGVSALIPEPYVLYYGLARDLEGEPLTAASQATVIVRIAGEENTRYTIGDPLAGNVNYVVRVRVDNGTGYLYDPGAAREGEQLEILIQAAGEEYMVDEPIPPVGSRGSINNVDIAAVPEPVTGIVLFLTVLSLARRKRDW